jgi:hypothetical protein
MSSRIIQIADNFWNIRGSFKIAGVIDIGTQASLVKRKNGKFIFLDSYTFSGDTKREIDELTNNGKDVETVLNLHPFHTIHVAKMHERYPHAKHYGTARHLAKFPDLNWEDLLTEDPKLHAKFASNFDFSVPKGVDFISDDENVHFSSVLVFHRSSRTIHVDDTLMYIRLPVLIRFFGLSDAMSFHPTLSKVLEKRAGATDDFQQWAHELAENWSSAENLCAAHTAALIAKGDGKASIQKRILKALDKVQSTLESHSRRFDKP